MDRSKFVSLTVVIVGMAAVLVGCQQPQEPPQTGPLPAAKQLTVMAPCGMIIPIETALEAFRPQAPGVAIEAKYDNSVVIAKKVVEKGERCDVFISPGPRQLEILRREGLVDEDSITPICSFELVVIVPRANHAGISEPEDLKKAKTVSMPDPESDSTGYAGRQALTSLGLWEAIEPNLVTTEHAIESHGFVASGKSQAGIAFRNCPLETNPEKLSLSKVAIAFSFPPDSYDTPHGLAAMTTDCRAPEVARRLIAFLASTEGQKILADGGLTPIGPTQAPEGQVAAAEGDEKSRGPQDAKVLVQAFYPASGHEHIKEVVFALADKYPGKVRAEFYDWAGDPDDRQVWRDKGLSCGAILINGKQTFEYTDDQGRTHQVTFMMGMGGEWTKEDVEAVASQAVREAYPE